MRRGTTESGFEFEIDEEDLDDMRFIELMAQAQTDVLKLPEVIVRMLGEEGKEALYNHVQNEKGRVRTGDIDKLIGEIMTLAGEDTKNSESSPT